MSCCTPIPKHSKLWKNFRMWRTSTWTWNTSTSNSCCNSIEKYFSPWNNSTSSLDDLWSIALINPPLSSLLTLAGVGQCPLVWSISNLPLDITSGVGLSKVFPVDLLQSPCKSCHREFIGANESRISLRMTLKSKINANVSAVMTTWRQWQCCDAKATTSTFANLRGND